MHSSRATSFYPCYSSAVTSISYIGPLGTHLWSAVLDGTPSRDANLATDRVRASRVSAARMDHRRITAVLGRDALPGFRVFNALPGTAEPVRAQPLADVIPRPDAKAAEPAAEAFVYNAHGAPVTDSAGAGPTVGTVVSTTA